MYLKNEDVKIGTIPDANGSDTPLRKMEFLTKKEMKDSSRLYGKVIVHISNRADKIEILFMIRMLFCY